MNIINTVKKHKILWMTVTVEQYLTELGRWRKPSSLVYNHLPYLLLLVMSSGVWCPSLILWF